MAILHSTRGKRRKINFNRTEIVAMATLRARVEDSVL